MELVVAVAIISVILIYLYQATNTMKISNDFYESKIKQESLKEKLFFALFRDVLQIEKNTALISSQEKQIDLFTFMTRNSHYDLINPRVGYFVNGDNTLFRVESVGDMTLPATEINLQSYRVEKVAEGVEMFRVFFENSKYLIHIRLEGQAPLMFQVAV